MHRRVKNIQYEDEDDEYYDDDYDEAYPPRSKEKAVSQKEAAKQEQQRAQKVNATVAALAKKFPSVPKNKIQSVSEKCNGELKQAETQIQAEANKIAAKAKPKAKPKAPSATREVSQPSPSNPAVSSPNQDAPLPPESASASSLSAAGQLKSREEEMLFGKPEVEESGNQNGGASAAAASLGGGGQMDFEDGAESLNLVVIGHVDAGKSTLMGHLLLQVGAVDQREVNKNKTEAQRLGKGSFFYAWLFDQGGDERERGVTIDVAVKHIRTPTKKRVITILDAPGHKDFVPAMLAGAVQADVALLVVDANDFAAGFERGGQTKEHIQLVRAVGVVHLLIAVNKLDQVGWKETVYQEVVEPLHAFITGPEGGFKSDKVTYIPVSAFEGTNIAANEQAELKAWWAGPTLLDALDSVPLRVPGGDPGRQNSGQGGGG